MLPGFKINFSIGQELDLYAPRFRKKFLELYRNCVFMLPGFKKISEMYSWHFSSQVLKKKIRIGLEPDLYAPVFWKKNQNCTGTGVVCFQILKKKIRIGRELVLNATGFRKKF